MLGNSRSKKVRKTGKLEKNVPGQMEVNTYRRGLGEIVKSLYLLRCNNRMVNKIKTRKIQVERRVGYCIT